MIVTIDGPAGAGKSTVARGLALRLGFEFLDTGAMFRAVALAALRAGVPFEDDGLHHLIPCITLQMGQGVVVLNGEDVSQAIRSPEVSSGASRVATSAVVRPFLAEQQRRIAEGRNMVCEGRDQGTVVFPRAGCKFFLTADPEERLSRRAAEMRAKGQAVDLDDLRRSLAERDARDSTREIAPLRAAADAVLLDTTGLSIEQVLDRMERVVRDRLGL